MAAPAAQWRLTRSEHFEVYAQLSDPRARAILTWFEQLRAFFEQQSGTTMGSSPPVRVIVFASDRQYQPYRLRSTADAYYVGSGSQDYIVMGADDPVKFGLAAHEYAHLALRAWNLQLPPWLTEGLAEFFATLRITGHATALGGTLPGRVQTLESRAWMPVADLMSLSEESRGREERAAANLFLRRKLGAHGNAAALPGLRSWIQEVYGTGSVRIAELGGVPSNLRQVR